MFHLADNDDIKSFQEVITDKFLEQLQATDLPPDAIKRLVTLCESLGLISGTLIALVYNAELHKAQEQKEYNQ